MLVEFLFYRSVGNKCGKFLTFVFKTETLYKGIDDFEFVL